MDNKQTDGKTVEGTRETAENERVALRLQLSMALSDNGFGESLVLSQETAEEVLTPNRREIVQALAEHDVASVRELSDQVDRNYGNVSRDLKRLVTSNIVGYEDTGSAKRPYLEHETVIVEPIVAPADLAGEIT